MSTVFDITGISIDDGTVVTLENPVTVVNTTLNAVESVVVEVPGMQGPPGVQNVYVQENDPAVEFGWGMEEKGYIWIEADV